MTLQATLAIQILEAALESPMGIRVEVQPISPDLVQAASRAKQILYRYKNENPDFKHLIIRFDDKEPDKFLWVHPGEINGDFDDQ